MKNQSSANDQNSWLQNDTRLRAQSVGERERERIHNASVQSLGMENFNRISWKIFGNIFNDIVQTNTFAIRRQKMRDIFRRNLDDTCSSLAVSGLDVTQIEQYIQNRRQQAN